jgi:MFS family permease
MVKFLRNNIYKLYLIKISHWLMLTMPVILLFYNSNHLSIRHLFIIQALYSITIVAFEIPSGYIADVWGRKKTLVMGSLLCFSGYMVYSFSDGFWLFLTAEILLGIGNSCISGTDTALLYDTMIALKEENRYLKVEGKMTSVGNFAEAIAGILGGLLATIHTRLPFIIQAVVALIAIPAALALIEPQLHTNAQKTNLKSIFSALRHVLFENKKLRQNIMISSVIGASTLSMAWFVQPYFKYINVPVALYGILWTILNASVGVAALLAYKFERKLGEIKTIHFIVISTTILYLCLWMFQSYWAILFILLFYMVRGIATPVLKDYINKQIPSETRASVLSLRNLIIRGIFSTLAPFMGYLSDKFSIQVALLMAGMCFLIFSLPFLFIPWHNLTYKSRTKPS